MANTMVSITRIHIEAPANEVQLFTWRHGGREPLSISAPRGYYAQAQRGLVSGTWTESLAWWSSTDPCHYYPCFLFFSLFLWRITSVTEMHVISEISYWRYTDNSLSRKKSYYRQNGRQMAAKYTCTWNNVGSAWRPSSGLPEKFGGRA